MPNQSTQTRAIALARRRGGPDLIYRALTVGMIAILVLTAVIATALPGRAQSAPPSFANLVEQVGDSVVNITTASAVASPMGPGPNLPPGSGLEEFFEDFMERGPGPMPRRSSALGSGFVISEDGFIVTNNHVIEGADQINVEFRDGRELEAQIVGTDPNTDIALLQVQSQEPLSFVAFGDSTASRVGDWVMAMGNPLGQGFSVSVGVVSAQGRALQGTYDDFIQTDAAINRGNSGGPLFNMNGEVVGVNTAILSPSGGSIGIGFAMSSQVVTRVIDQLQQYGETRRGWLGVRIQDMDEDMAAAMDLDAPRGAIVTDVPEGPARDAGVQVGDVILSFDGQQVDDTRELVRVVGNAPVGETVRMVVMRDTETRTLRVTLGRRETEERVAFPDDSSSDPAVPERSQMEMLGMTLAPVGPQTRPLVEPDGLQSGLVIQEIDPLGPAADKGLQVGDVIVSVRQQNVETLSDFTAQVEAAREAGQQTVLMMVRRGDNNRFVALSIDMG